MTRPQRDNRSPERRGNDERIAAEAHTPPPAIPAGAIAMPLEAHHTTYGDHAIAIAGIVENGIVKPLDSSVQLPEHARVIILAPGTE